MSEELTPLQQLQQQLLHALGDARSLAESSRSRPLSLAITKLEESLLWLTQIEADAASGGKD
jgi:hypothetical protein